MLGKHGVPSAPILTRVEVFSHEEGVVNNRIHNPTTPSSIADRYAFS
jgi:hypothetical protein